MLQNLTLRGLWFEGRYLEKDNIFSMVLSLNYIQYSIK